MGRLTRLRAVAIVLFVVLVLSGGSAVATDSTDRDISTVDSDHGLADGETIDDYQSSGVVETELSQFDGSLTIAESGDDVGLGDELTPADVRNDFLVVEYREDFDRTLRIHIPREYMTPYSQSSVSSVTTEHNADFEPVRGGEYLEVVVHVDEPAEIVLPLQRDSAASYRAVEWADNRIEAVTGITAFSGDEWEHISGDELTESNATIELGPANSTVVQYDAYGDDAEETWLNAPSSEDDDVGVHTMTRTENGTETMFVTATGDEPPDIRYNTDAGQTDRISGWVNDAREIPDRAEDFLDALRDATPLGVMPV